MKRILCISIFLVGLACHSSQKTAGSKAPPENLFLELWEIFDAHYAFFELRGIDWAVEKTQRQALFAEIQNDSIRFEAFCQLLKEFGDSHINLESDELNATCNAGATPDFFKEFPSNETYSIFLKARDQSLKKMGIHQLKETESGLFQFGLAETLEWGYLRIKRFYGADLKTIQSELDEIMGKMQPVRQLILDIRLNPGGNDETALLCAGYFFKRKEIAYIKRVRAGKGHEDFSSPDTTYVFPNKKGLFDRPVYLLTNSASGSSADVFALVLSSLPRVSLIGTNTEGIFSDMHRDTLSNGWRLTLSNERYFSKDMICYEKVGIPVDVEVPDRRSEAEKGIDPVIEAARQWASKSEN